MMLDTRTEIASSIAYLTMFIQVRKAILRKTTRATSIEEWIPPKLPITDPYAETVPYTSLPAFG